MKREHIDELLEIAKCRLNEDDIEYLYAMSKGCRDYDLLEKMEEEIAKWNEIVEELEAMRGGKNVEKRAY